MIETQPCLESPVELILELLLLVLAGPLPYLQSKLRWSSHWGCLKGAILAIDTN